MWYLDAEYTTLASDHGLTQSLASARAGSRHAIAELLHAFRAYLQLVAKTEGDRRGYTSDLIQITLIEAHRDLPSFRGNTAKEVRGWLLQILRNNVIDASRRTKHAGHVKNPLWLDTAWPGFLALVATDQSPSSCMQSSEAAQKLTAAIQSLPPHFARAVLLRHYGELSFGEVGLELRCSAEAARKVYLRALVELRKNLGGGCD